MERKYKEQMAESILDAVISCKRDAAGGYVSLAQVASRAGISERTLNRYFPDKEMMTYKAAVRYLRRRYEELEQRYASADKSSMDALKKLLFLVHMQMDRYQEDLADAMMFVRAYITCLNTAIYKKLCSPGFDEPVRRIVISCIEEGIADGSMRTDVVPMDTYLLISSNFNGLVQRLIYLYSIDLSEEENKQEILNVFTKYLRMLEEFLSANGRAGVRQS